MIVIYKTAYYSFYLPVALAMHICQIPTSYTIGSQTVQPYSVALSILIPLGEYFQVQDDFLDYSCPPEKLGKVGTDIIDNKCSWCINTALALASPEQRKVLDANYGRKDSQAEAKVKDIFGALALTKVYEEYEENVYKKLMSLIDAIPEADGQDKTLKRDVFKSFVGKIYKRSM